MRRYWGTDSPYSLRQSGYRTGRIRPVKGALFSILNGQMESNITETFLENNLWLVHSFGTETGRYFLVESYSFDFVDKRAIVVC
jgi:hypothetical protein